MSAQSFHCPNCGAPLDYKDSEASTIRCPFCETSVIVPDELRPDRSPQIETISVSLPNFEASPARPKRKPAVAILVSLLILLIVLGVAVLPYLLENQAAKEAESTAAAISEVKAASTAAPSSTPKPSPTPAFASPVLSFGESGIGAGMFSDARYIVVDGGGTIYVGDYQGGRVQAFDRDGKYLRQWKVGDANTILYGMAANHKGEVFVSSGEEIRVIRGTAGKPGFDFLWRLSIHLSPQKGDRCALAKIRGTV